MLNTREEVLRNFWYATPPVETMTDGPKPFRLLGRDVVLFLAENDAGSRCTCAPTAPAC